MTFDPEEILEAIRTNEFYLEYMPIVSLTDCRCVAAEALVRWNRRGERVAPDRFIPQLEETPLIGLLTYWVIETIVKELGAVLEAHPRLHISLNVPPELFGRGGLVHSALAVDARKLFPQIVLELTERGTPDRISIEGIRFARTLGLGIAIDDIEAGNLNLLLLARSRVDYVKLDKSLVNLVVENRAPRPALRDLDQILQAHTPLVVAEGIETEAQFEALRQRGVQLGQGWYFSPSLRAPDFVTYFLSRP